MAKDKLIEMTTKGGEVRMVHPEDVEHRKSIGWKIAKESEVKKPSEK